MRATQHFVRKPHGFTSWKQKAEGPFGAEECRIAHTIARELDRCFPGHKWKVEVDVTQGVALVYFELFTTWQEVIHLKDLFSDPTGLCVRKAGGAFLERYRMPRQGMDIDRMLEAKDMWQPAFTNRLRPPD